MSRGIPGYDFGAQEVVTADALRRWLEYASWNGLSYSETTGELIAVRTGENQPGDTSEGLLWYQPSRQKLHVYTRRGWVGIFNPLSWETIRARATQTGAYPKNRRYKVVEAYNTSVTSGIQFALGGQTAGAGEFIDLACSAESWAGSMYYPLCGWGMCEIDHAGALLSNAHGDLIRPNSVGQLVTPISDWTAATNALDLNVVVIVTDLTLATPFDYHSGVFFFGFPLHLHRSDGL